MGRGDAVDGRRLRTEKTLLSPVFRVVPASGAKEKNPDAGESADSTMTDPSLRGLGCSVRMYMKDWDVPGCAVGVLRRNRMAFAGGFGRRDLRRGLPVTTNTLFRIGSCTKAFTAAGVGILVDEGELAWDTPVREYLPSFRLRDPVAAERTTLRDILSHRTGMGQHSDVWFGSSMSRGELLGKLAGLRPVREFRSAFEYSGLMYAVAGLVIERVTGQTWEDFSRDRIFDRLGMGDSYCMRRDAHALQQARDREAVGYVKRGKQTVPYFRGKKRNSSAAEELGPIGPAGSIVSSAADMCSWLSALLSGGGNASFPGLSAESLREICTPQVPEPGLAPFPELLDASYAMGWRVQSYRGLRDVWHGGQCCGMTAGVSFLPDEGVGVVVLTNAAGHPLWRMLPFIVYDRLLGLRPIRWNSRFGKAIGKNSRGKRKRDA